MPVSHMGILMAHRRRALRTMASIAAILLQVHLFLVLQLHHHGLNVCRVLEFSSISDGGFHARPPEAPLLPCPACHVAEHSLVQHAEPGDLIRFLPQAGDVLDPATLLYACLREQAVCGRDPPRS